MLAFAMNLITGLLFFAGNTYKYIDNSAFELKLILILIAGLNALFYRWRLSYIVDTEEVTRTSICVGYLSLFLWAGVIICGRMITFYARNLQWKQTTSLFVFACQSIGSLSISHCYAFDIIPRPVCH